MREEILETESVVKERYGAGAQAVEAALCCPVDYDPKYLEVIPAEVIEKDYGCGVPSKYVRPGETVLDLGSGTGKICFIASQVVGAEGKVIGVDMTDDMLEVARRNAPSKTWSREQAQPSLTAVHHPPHVPISLHPPSPASTTGLAHKANLPRPASQIQHRLPRPHILARIPHP